MHPYRKDSVDYEFKVLVFSSWIDLVGLGARNFELCQSLGERGNSRMLRSLARCCRVCLRFLTAVLPFFWRTWCALILRWQLRVAVTKVLQSDFWNYFLSGIKFFLKFWFLEFMLNLCFSNKHVDSCLCGHTLRCQGHHCFGGNSRGCTYQIVLNLTSPRTGLIVCAFFLNYIFELVLVKWSDTFITLDLWIRAFDHLFSTCEFKYTCIHVYVCILGWYCKLCLNCFSRILIRILCIIWPG